ncbi:tripartite tricarboxylate transporter substrate binding protein [Roseomonas sp. GC11]|uniref:Bug family tripartite tricarboxylate transporter substrate binding protein n=1 Tax=Roseomonas sp. GC11 TaxID=2950546 RepID=UPI00210E51FF|nr:tripartite tricarboxylate transporter substrate binding protein [Roseomonas sp. GC11]MCQ4159991.1 tripartite tricarboxylate transporter substrate binding protein [Roseomonas sp. GC11]
MLDRRRLILSLGLAAPALALGRGVAAQGAAATSWPQRPVRLVVPYPPGGATDVLGRLYAEHLGAILGQTVVVENRPGASGNIGIDAVAKSPADGYTIGAATVSNFSINQFLYASVAYNVEKDLTPVALGWEFPNVAVVAPRKVQARTLAEFVAWARGRSGGITYGSTGIGTTTHLSSAMLFSRLGIEAVHVPYRGAAQIIPALLNGEVDFAIDGVASYQGLIGNGDIRALAVTTAERWPSVPEVPTMAEAGMADFVVTVWGGFVVPAGTPAAVVQKINAGLKQVVDDPALRERFAKVGARPIWTTPEDAAARAARERPMWRKVIQDSGARAD